MIQDKTQQHKTHNNQHEMPSPCPPAALPSPSMGRSVVPTTHGIVASYGPMLGARGLIWRCHGRFLHLECRRIPHQKIEQWAWPTKLKRKTKHQPCVGISGGRESGEVARGGWSARGNIVPLFGMSNGAMQKK